MPAAKSLSKITCPYSWDCGKSFEIKTLSKSDFKFLKSAILKTMNFMFIHCPSCTREFQFDTVSWKSEASHYVNPNIKSKPKKEKTFKQYISLLKKSKVEIPPAYLKYLISDKFKAEISVVRGEYAFTLYDLNELCEKLEIDDNEYLTIKQLKGFVKTLVEVLDTKSKKYIEKIIPLTDLSKSLAIGYENTSILFIDSRDNQTLWIFHPDGGDISKTSMTVNKIVTRIK